jgi:hypothetical protein
MGRQQSGERVAVRRPEKQLAKRRELLLDSQVARQTQPSECSAAAVFDRLPLAKRRRRRSRGEETHRQVFSSTWSI